VSNSQLLHKVNIRPSVTVLSVLKHLNYKPWFALAEFVDNAIQSYFDNEQELRATDGNNYKLRVEIEISPDDGGQIIVRDNAAGIALADFPRAFRPAEIPPDRSGLSEFGMGMKSAAFWFASKWSVRTSALGETVEREVKLDINSILADKLEDLGVVERPAKAESHFTELILTDLHQNPIGRTLAKIQEHLCSIYRVYLRDGTMELVFKGESLSYPTPPVLKAPYFKTPSGEAMTWRKDIDFDFGDGLRAHGFAALFEVGSTSRAGFALFRRNRLIEGSADEGYRPHAIFGNPNDYSYQRVFGELHLEGFEVSHTKDGFRWHDNEEAFLQLLQEELDNERLPILKQAEGHRVRPKAEDFVKGAEKANQRTTETIQKCAPPVIQKQHEIGPETTSVPSTLPQARHTASTREIEVDVNAVKWLIRIELSTDPAVGDWLSVSDAASQPPSPKSRRLLCLRLSLTHPFMQQYCGTTADKIEPILRIAAALALAETNARDSGVQYAGTIRRNINQLLRDAFAAP
jgi:hypothetical protein